ncbi:hypothetical protein FQN52_002986 [Onygenales sp. PD_12]|nr:hypothetical protein FQN52_002986 [Onygenales sp. PD_12]
MESWRERGFVPDSDEEDDFESQPRVVKASEVQEQLGESEAGHDGGMATERREAEKGSDAEQLSVDPVGDGQESQAVAEVDGGELSGGEEGVEEMNGNGDTTAKQLEVDESPESDDEDRQESQIIPPTTLPKNYDLGEICEAGDTTGKAPDTPAPNSLEEIPDDRPESQIVPQPLREISTIADYSDEDPLQDGQPPNDRITGPRLSNTANHAASSSDMVQPDSPSNRNRSPSPDELHFEQHFRRRTPTKQPSQMNTSTDDKGNESEESSLSEADSNPEIPPSFLDDHHTTRRSLRDRKFIQLHPYLFDQAQYQKFCTSNNIRPIRVQTEDRRPGPQDDSQNQEFMDENLPPSSSPSELLQLSQSPRPEGSKQKGVSRTARPLGSLPHTGNIGNIAVSRRPNSLAGEHPTEDANKRRKISHTSDKGGNVSGEQRRNQIQVVVENAVPPTPSRPNGIFEVPLSPPSSGANSLSSKLPRPAKFRFPPGYSTPALVTPVTDKRPSPQKLDAVSIDDSSSIDLDAHLNDDGDSGPQSALTSAADEVEEVEEVEEAEEAEEVEERGDPEAADYLRRIMQRRTKGVLPASWVRLDLQQQQEREKAAAEKQRLIQIQDRRRSGKGVAQRISRQRSNSGGPERPRANPFLVSDDSSSENETANIGQNTRDLIANLVEDDNEPFRVQGDDIPEDNRIDYMLPPAPRRATHRIPQDRPRRYTNDQRGPRSESSLRPRSRPQHQTRITDSLKRPRVTPSKPRLPRLGILDSTDVRDQPVRKQPQFLRVAARQARSRRDHGRKSPSRKFLRLGTRLDTDDVNMSLREWRAGSLRQSTIPGNHPRKRQRQGHGNREPAPSGDSHNDPVAQPFEPDARYSIPGTDIGVRSDRNKAPSESHLIAQEGSVKSSRVSQPKSRAGQRWTVRNGGFVISSLRRNAPRPAQLEVSGPSTRRLVRPSNFQRSLSALNSLYKSSASRLDRDSNLPLARFLAETPQNALPLPPPEDISSGGLVDSAISPEPDHISPPRRRRKRAPQHINAETVEHGQPVNIDVDIAETYSVKSAEAIELPALKGLKTFGTEFSTDFGIFPLQLGAYFHESTFIGSGELSRSMKLSSRNLDDDNGRAIVKCGDQTYQWGPWDETVSSELGHVFDVIREAFDAFDQPSDISETTKSAKASQALLALRSVIAYVNEKLFFMDPIDRSMFVDRCLTLLSKVSGELQFTATGRAPDSTEAAGFQIKLETLSYVFANQLRQVASHELISPRKYSEIIDGMTAAQNMILRAVLGGAGSTDIKRCLEENKWRSKRESGIRDDHPFVEAFLVVHSISRLEPMLVGINEDLLSQAILPPSTSQLPRDIRELERLWHAVFTTLPLYEFDEAGIFYPGDRFKQSFDQWHTIKRLLLPAFDTYTYQSNTLSASFNNYCRALFQRCFYLIDSWAWRQCKPILDTLFDFFAANKFHNLNQEQCLGSPSFLDELDRQPVLELEPKDSCFHILLKTIGLGLRKLGDIHNKKKIRNFAWRLLPNHGREYPKEETLRQEDLDALRNHHDLLCTLYWATPDGCRPRLETIRNLVHPIRSHKEACSINMHSWLRLVRFKLSTDEDSADLVPFAGWHASFVLDMLKQHSQARAEIEAQVTASSIFSRQTIEKAIIENQQQTESLLSHALVNLRIAIDAAKSPDQAKGLIDKLPITKLLELFNHRVARFHGLACKTLDVVLSYTSLNKTAPAPSGPAEASEDSQDFGDWTVLAELCDGEEPPKANPASEYLDVTIRPAVSRFLASCFGEDQAPDDTVLLKVVDCWTSIAHSLVRSGLRQWTSYLNPYDGDSWASLRATDQTRKFLPYFLAKMVDKDTAFYMECKSQVLCHWVECIVERGSMLKYQHMLTNAIVNGDGKNPLLTNLPFSKDWVANRYDMTLEEFSQRRLSLISCILSNMREHLSETQDLSTHVLQGFEDQYRGLIQALMGAMKSNYGELGKASSSVHSSYVDFVHGVVTFLQQHSQGICPIDPFFTNPSTFPLPADDPTYIVGKLKGYGVRLSSGKVANQLITFLQNVSERAAVDGQQKYLVDQLYSAMSESHEPGESHQSTIRLFLLHCIFPAYVEISLSNPAAWILTRPLLQSLTRILIDSCLYVNAGSTQSITTFVVAMTSYFEAVDNALRLLIDHPGLLEEPHILLTATSLLETIIASLPIIDYLDRASTHATTLVAYVTIFKQFTHFAVSTLLDPQSATVPDSLDTILISLESFQGEQPDASAPFLQLPPFFTDARSFAARGLQSRLQDGWSLYNGKYFVRHGQQVKEVVVDESCMAVDVARGAFVGTVEAFFGTMGRLETFAEEED